MGQYKIEIKPSTLPDSNKKKDVVLVATKGGPRNGERLGVGKYHVTVIDEEGLRCPGQILHVDAPREGRYTISLEYPGGALREVTDEELSGLKFEFVSTEVVL